MHCKPWVRVSTRCSLVRPAYQMRAIKYCVVSASALRKETSSYPLACIGIFSGTWCSGLGQYWTPVLCVSLCRPSLLIANESNHKFKLQQVLFWSRGLGLCFVQWQIRSTGLHPLNFKKLCQVHIFTSQASKPHKPEKKKVELLWRQLLSIDQTIKPFSWKLLVFPSGIIISVFYNHCLIANASEVWHLGFFGLCKPEKAWKQ